MLYCCSITFVPCNSCGYSTLLLQQCHLREQTEDIVTCPLQVRLYHITLLTRSLGTACNRFHVPQLELKPTVGGQKSQQSKEGYIFDEQCCRSVLAQELYADAFLCLIFRLFALRKVKRLHQRRGECVWHGITSINHGLHAWPLLSHLQSIIYTCEPLPDVLLV